MIYCIDWTVIIKLVAQLHAEKKAVCWSVFGFVSYLVFWFLDVCMHTCLDVPSKWM